MGSNKAIAEIFLLIFHVTSQKLSAERNNFGEKWKYIKSNRPCRKKLSKVIHSQKYPKIGNAGGRVLLLVTFQARLSKNDSTRSVFLEAFRKFSEQLGIIDFRD